MCLRRNQCSTPVIYLCSMKIVWCPQLQVWAWNVKVVGLTWNMLNLNTKGARPMKCVRNRHACDHGGSSNVSVYTRSASNALKRAHEQKTTSDLRRAHPNSNPRRQTVESNFSLLKPTCMWEPRIRTCVVALHVLLYLTNTLHYGCTCKLYIFHQHKRRYDAVSTSYLA